MSNDRLRELEEIAKTLAEAREKLEKLQASRNLPGTDALHSAISYAHWLCYRVYDGTLPQPAHAFRTVCVN